MKSFILSYSLLFLPSLALAQENKRTELPAGERVKAPMTRDTWFSNVDQEANGNCGGATRLKLKSIQEMSLIDIDPAPLRGRVVNGATLHLRSTGEPRLKRVTVSSFGAEWVEGTATDYMPQKGSSTHSRRQYPDVLWAGPGSDLCSVMLGLGGTTWRMADASPPDAEGWQKIAVDPSVVAARLAGVSYGFLLFDDTGTEWKRNGNAFKIDLFPNRFVYSREAGEESAPYLTIYLGAEDKAPPAAPTDLRGDPADLPAGEATLRWTTPKDSGPAGTVGFFVTINGKDVPRYLIPLAGKPGEPVRMHLRDLDLEGGSEAAVAIKAVDGAGNIGPALEGKVRVSDRLPPVLPGKALAPFTAFADLPKLGATPVAVIDELDKMQPLTGEMIPPQSEEYLSANHLWSAKNKRIRLHGARNEFLGFQVLLRGPVKALKADFAFDDTGRGIPTQVGYYLHVKSKKGPLPDPVVPLGNVPIDMAANTSLHCEVFVPHNAGAGLYSGKLTLSAGRQRLVLNLTLRVWDFTLPDHLSFLPEMNCYGLPENERDYYRMAHVHRTVMNKVPYYQNGNVQEGSAPGWNGKDLQWRDFDRRFGPLLDGSAFSDLPRKGVPVECFYLPLFENWPAPMEGNYNGSYWADRAFPAKYRSDLVEVSRGFAGHFAQAGWNDTLFQFFLNGKNNFKEEGWSRGTSPWLLDEPANFQDYWALRWFGAAFHEGVNAAPVRPKMTFRADISRPQWQRDALDGLLDYNVVSSALRPYHRMVMDRKKANGEIVLEYGTTNAIDDANMQPVGWSLDAWSLGADGVVPWQTIGTGDSWKDADELALFYPGRDDASVIPSVRLKAYRRGQQDVEYCTLVTRLMKEPRWAVGRSVRSALKLSGERKASQAGGADDAGVVHYAKLKPQDAWALRVRLGAALDEAKPKAARRLVEFQTPPRDPARLPPAYVSVGQAIYETPPPPPAATPTGRPVVLQGRPAVRDALIDPEQPDKNFGAEGRGNALRKADKTSAFLVRFDLDRLKLPKGAKVNKATVSFYVWDPSNQGNTKVCAFGLKTPWDEKTATWNRPAAKKTWQGGEGFNLDKDAGAAGPPAIVKPDMAEDTVDPPIEYQLDVTALVKTWLAGTDNHGLAIVSVPDRATDDGFHTRFQIYGSEASNAAYGPKLTVLVEP